jgi:hypothetical protein
MNDLRVNITGNRSGFQQVLDESRTHAKKFADELGKEVGDSWGGIGKSIVGGIAGFLSVEGIKEFIGSGMEAARTIKETAEQFDLSTDSVQKWEQALDKAGVAQATFYRSLETLRSKREEARQDPSKREDFRALGLTDQALDASVSDEDLLKRVLTSGKSRALIDKVLGSRGARLGAALPLVRNEAPAMDTGTIEGSAEAGKAAKSFWHQSLAFSAGVGSALWKSMAHPIETLGNMMADNANAGRTQEAQNLFKDHQAAKQAAQDKKDADEEMARAERHRQLLAGEEKKEHDEDAAQRLEEARRGNMTIGQRRDSLHAELNEVATRILKERRLLENGGLTAEEKDKLTPDEQKKLIEQRQIRFENDQSRREKIYGDLREKPFDIPADSLAKVGLFTSAALNIGKPGGEDIPRQQLSALIRIDQTLRNRRDPHAP